MKFLMKFRKTVMLFVKALILLSVTLCFIDIWLKFYPDSVFYRNGNYLIVFSYILLFGLLSSNFNGFKIGIYRIHEIVYFFTISLIATNSFIYLELSLIARYLLNPIPLLIATILQIIIIVICSFCANEIYFTLYKAKTILALFANSDGFALINKMGAIPKRFKIEQGVNVNNIPINEIKRLIDKYECVIICDIDKNIEQEIFLYCYEKQKRTYLLPSITDIIINNSYEIQISDTPVLMSRNRPLSTEQEIFKRVSDIIISALLLILTLPITLLTAILIKICDGGPIFFKQNRVTKNGKIFNILKFRSMVVGADKIGSNTTSENDPRITKIGKIIRTLRIDELPQLLNVLLGDMSIVGPRPERVENVYKYSKNYPQFDLRHKVKAGITGFAQIYGKYNTSPKDKLNMDLFYIETYSPLQDIKLLFLTLKVIFTKSSTEGFSAPFDNTDEKSNSLKPKK